MSCWRSCCGCVEGLCCNPEHRRMLQFFVKMNVTNFQTLVLELMIAKLPKKIDEACKFCGRSACCTGLGGAATCTARFAPLCFNTRGELDDCEPSSCQEDADCVCQRETSWICRETAQAFLTVRREKVLVKSASLTQMMTLDLQHKMNVKKTSHCSHSSGYMLQWKLLRYRSGEQTASTCAGNYSAIEMIVRDVVHHSTEHLEKMKLVLIRILLQFPVLRNPEILSLRVITLFNAGVKRVGLQPAVSFVNISLSVAQAYNARRQAALSANIEPRIDPSSSET